MAEPDGRRERAALVYGQAVANLASHTVAQIARLLESIMTDSECCGNNPPIVKIVPTHNRVKFCDDPFVVTQAAAVLAALGQRNLVVDYNLHCALGTTDAEFRDPVLVDGLDAITRRTDVRSLISRARRTVAFAFGGSLKARVLTAHDLVAFLIAVRTETSSCPARRAGVLNSRLRSYAPPADLACGDVLARLRERRAEIVAYVEGTDGVTFETVFLMEIESHIRTVLKVHPDYISSGAASLLMRQELTRAKLPADQLLAELRTGMKGLNDDLAALAVVEQERAPAPLVDHGSALDLGLRASDGRCYDADGRCYDAGAERASDGRRSGRDGAACYSCYDRTY